MPNFSLADEVFFEAARRFETPFHLYDENGIRQTARGLIKAFSSLPEFREYFAVKALPNPAVLKILKEEGCGVDCASVTELMLADACGFHGDEIMFSANDVPDEEFVLARSLDAIINLDDYNYAAALIRCCGDNMPEEVCLRYNPGGDFKIGNTIMGNPADAKYGMTAEQMRQALEELKAHGVKRFGIHAFLSSNTTDPGYYPTLAGILCRLGVEMAEKTGVQLSFINLSGGIGIPYLPDQPKADIDGIGAGVAKVYHEVFDAAGVTGVKIKSELGRYMTGPNGWLVTHIINEKNIYKHYLGLDACACDLMRPAMYGAYHHITIPGKEDLPHDELVDVTGSLCENNDKFAVDRYLPKTEIGDIAVIHDTGAHGLSMGYNYNGKLRCKEVLLQQDGSFRMIRRAERPADYFATLDQDEVFAFMKEKYGM